jgi:Asp/Glu/hydantoin racemase
MKLWYQSAVEFRSDDRWQLYEKSLKKHISQLLEQRSTFRIHGLKDIADGNKDKNNSDKYREFQFCQNAIAAESQGFSSFAIGCWKDYGNTSIRRNTRLIVLSIAEASLHAALLLGRKAGLIMPHSHDKAVVKENLKNYGLKQSSIIFSVSSINKETYLNAFSNPSSFYNQFAIHAKSLIEKGADVIVAGHGVFNEILYNMKMRKIEGVPILDSTSALIKAIELFDKNNIRG